VETFPYALQAQHAWRWFPGLPSQPDPTQIELSLADFTPSVVPTNGGASYMTLTQARHVRREQGTYPDSVSPPVETYVATAAAGGSNAVMLRDSTASVSMFDPFGYALVEDISTVGVDLTVHVERTFKNDTDAWILGQLQTQKECSSAAMLTQCRTL